MRQNDEASLGDLMRRTVFVLTLAVFAVLTVHLPAEAYMQETSGYYKGVANGRITIELTKSQGRDYFWVNTATRVVNVGRPMTLSRIPKNSVVKVTFEGGTAVEVLVVEVPK